MREVGDTDRLGQEWREAHADRGDAAVAAAERWADQAGGADRAQAWALIAQAHYAAANVRAKPAPVTDPAVAERLDRWLAGGAGRDGTGA